jgi:hypothetical protein
VKDSTVGTDAGAALLRQCRPLYRREVPRRPTDYALEGFTALPIEPAVPVRNGLTTAIPDHFEVFARVEGLNIRIEARAAFGAGGHVRVTGLTVNPADFVSGTITSSGLRRAVLVDELVRRAIAELEVPWTDLPDAGLNVGQVPGDQPGEAWYSPPSGQRRRPQEDLVAQAARIYNAALEKGSRAPTMAVGLQLRYSRSQASRLVRAAREQGLIAPDAWPAPGGTVLIDPYTKPQERHRGPDIFQDPEEPIQAEPSRGKNGEED